MKRRKPSWQYLFFALRIQTGPRHIAAKLILIHLADAANDSGKSWHGYKSISALCNGLSKSSIYSALVHLRDDLKLLTWEKGSGGFNKKDTNTYTLDLEAMKALVCAQGVFDSETGKLVRSEDEGRVLSPNPTELQSISVTEPSVGIGEASVGIGEGSVGIGEALGRYRSPIPNPHGTPRIEPTERNPGPPALFWANGSASAQPILASSTSTAPCPPVARPPQTGFRYGDPLPGLQWSDHRGFYVDRYGKEPPVNYVDRLITEQETRRSERISE